MIRKLQIKFVAMCMILVTAVLGVVFTAVFFSAKQNIEVISHQVLQRVMEDDTPSGRPDLGLNRGGEDVLLPYFTVNLWDRSGIYEAFVTGGTYSNLQDTQELQTILTDCLQQNRPEGTIHSYGLRYLRRDYGLYERIAFVDMSMEQATLQELMGSYLQIGLAALVITVLAMAGSLLCLTLLRRFVLKLDHYGLPRGSEAAREEEAHHGGKADNSLTFLIVIAVVLGMLAGRFVLPAAVTAHCGTVISFGLYLLLFMVGMDMGKQGTLLADIKTAGFQVLLVPVAGVSCLLFPALAEEALPWYLGVPMVVSAIGSIVAVVRERDAGAGRESLGSAIVLCVLGLVIIVHGANSTVFIGIVWGLLGLQKAARTFDGIFSDIRHKRPFAVALAFCVLQFVLSVLLILNPFANIEHHLIVLGIELILYPFKLHRKHGKLKIEAEA